MRFGGEVQDVGHAVLLQHLEHIALVAQIDFLKAILRVLVHAGEVLEMTGIGEAIEVHEAIDLGLIDEPADDIGADETSATGYEQAHESD